MSESTTQETELRQRALTQLKKRRDFKGHVLIYLLVNAFLVVIWAVTGTGFFWPVFPLVGWGIAVVMNAWDVYLAGDIDEEDIRREVDRLRSQR
jgi:hypothetical protein